MLKDFWARRDKSAVSFELHPSGCANVMHSFDVIACCMPPPRSQKETEQEACLQLQEGCRQLAHEKENGLKINIKRKASELNVLIEVDRYAITLQCAQTT
jgi:hypothetical protein